MWIKNQTHQNIHNKNKTKEKYKNRATSYVKRSTNNNNNYKSSDWGFSLSLKCEWKVCSKSCKGCANPETTSKNSQSIKYGIGSPLYHTVFDTYCFRTCWDHFDHKKFGKPTHNSAKILFLFNNTQYSAKLEIIKLILIYVWSIEFQHDGSIYTNSQFVGKGTFSNTTHEPILKEERKKNNCGILLATIAIYCFFVPFYISSFDIFFSSFYFTSNINDDNHIRQKHSNQEVFFLNFTWNLFLDYKLTNSYTRVTWIVFCFDNI